MTPFSPGDVGPEFPDAVSDINAGLLLAVAEAEQGEKNLGNINQSFYYLLFLYLFRRAANRSRIDFLCGVVGTAYLI